jgi:hypothetical protein
VKATTQKDDIDLDIDDDMDVDVSAAVTVLGMKIINQRCFQNFDVLTFLQRRPAPCWSLPKKRSVLEAVERVRMTAI